MFSGLIEAVGTVALATRTPAGLGLRVRCRLAAELAAGDSIAVNGVCLTAVETDDEAFTADVSPETARVTTLGAVAEGMLVNLERPLRADGRIGGHFVLGHVDATGRVAEIREEAEYRRLGFEHPPALKPLIVPKGSIAVDGISLTVAALGRASVRCSDRALHLGSHASPVSQGGRRGESRVRYHRQVRAQCGGSDTQCGGGRAGGVRSGREALTAKRKTDRETPPGPRPVARTPGLFAPVDQAVEAIRKGEMVIVVDDEDRENEGDLTIAAERITPEAINFMARFGRGLICLPMTGERLDELQIPMMVRENTSRFETAFAVSIEARDVTSTGISAADRAATVRVAIDPATRPADLAQPGHMFPLRARRGGVLVRAGQTEAAVDLARLAGLYSAA